MESIASVVTLGALTLQLAGCGGVGVSPQPAAFDEPTAVEDEPAPDAAMLPTDSAPAVPWRSVGELTVDDFGEAGWISIPFPADRRYVAVRTIPLDAGSQADERACHRVAEGRLASGRALLPGNDEAAEAEHQRLRPGPGGAVVVLSSTVAPLDEADVLELRIELVDCALGIPASRARFPAMPHALEVDAAWDDAPAEPDGLATVGVRILRAEDSGWGPLAQDPALAEAWGVAVERFADAGVELVLQAEVATEAVGTVRYGADMLGFGELDAEVRATLQASPDDSRFVPVVLVRCLQTEDATGTTGLRPLGQTTRIPGSLADPRTPSLVVLAAGDCGSEEAVPVLEPTGQGLVLAHELAHYLGLLHVDHDGDHLPAGDDEQLMRSSIALDVEPDDAWLSAAQAVVLRRHPDVVVLP